MITFNSAIEIVLSNSLKYEGEFIPLSEALGRVLAQPVYADRDMPPFDKSAVDGYACKAADIVGDLKVLENIAAGFKPSKVVTSGCCSKIMTGAMLPEGADTVIMVEECEDNGATVKFNGKSLKSNICYKGEDIHEGDKVLESGVIIKPEQIAILASFGVSNVFVAKQKMIGILSTGDEIVEPDIIPTLVQIRNSNGWQLRAQSIRAGAIVNYYGIASDTEISLIEKLEKAIKDNDIVILSGGVSMGDFDFVPAALDKLGLKTLFNKVAVQPGKPSTFAVKYSQSGITEKVVFALPGNPVSCFVQFELLIKPFLYKSMGGVAPGIKTDLPFKSDYSRKHPERLALIPVKIDSDGSFSPVKYNGSAHITALNGANGIAEIPIGVANIAAGERVKVYILP